jgi:uncharacterized protein YqcC (DUF446 family)/Tfp pilus assembly protein PilF
MPTDEEIRARLADVVAAMKRTGAWDIARPKDEAFVDMGAFGMRTMAFEQWLRYVFVPSVEERLASGGPWPSSSSVGVQATREGDTDPVARELTEPLRAFDSLFERPAPTVLRALEPPPRARAPYERSRTALASGDHRAALAAVSEALLLDHAYPNAHNLAGWILFNWPSRTPEQLHGAIAHYRQALKDAPQYGVPLTNLCDALVAAEREDEAVLEAERETKSPEWERVAYAFNWLGWRALSRPETIAASVDLFRKAVARRPHWGIPHANLAKALELMGHADEAYAEHQHALSCGDASDPAFSHERRSAFEVKNGWLRNALVSMRRAFAEDHARGGARKATYGPALDWLEAQLRAQGIEPPAPGHENEASWGRACEYERPAGYGDRNEYGEPIAEEVIAVERLLRAGQWDAAVAALKTLDIGKLIDAIGYASSGVDRALAAGVRDAAFEMQRLVVNAYVAYASMSTSGGEAMGRMLDVDRERKRLGDLERSK